MNLSPHGRIAANDTIDAVSRGRMTASHLPWGSGNVRTAEAMEAQYGEQSRIKAISYETVKPTRESESPLGLPTGRCQKRPYTHHRVAANKPLAMQLLRWV